MRARTARPLVPLVLTLSLAAQGCVYVTQKVREEKLTTIDQDGDGAPYDGPLGKRDCDDNNKNKSPLLDEIPYDGLDNDCAGDGDLVDIDGDGYPGILFADWKPEQGVRWPDNVDQVTLDCVDFLDPELDADKIALGWDATRIYPEPFNNDELVYDGIDSDCQADNDFDGDGDGYLRDNVQSDFDAYVSNWGYEDRVSEWFPGGTALYGDCDDSDPDAYPGDQEDELYDGLDANCDGVNDFDGDGDGWMPPTLPQGGDVEPAFEAFVARYNLQELAASLPADITVGPDGGVVLTAFDDCLDAFDPILQANGQPVDPATVYPRERSEPVAGLNGDEVYDGVDTDCNRDNDFDRDRDGYLVSRSVLPEVLVAYPSYIEQWGYEGELGAWGAENDDITLLEPPWPEENDTFWEDCADDDALTYPAALERIGDGQDQDCDGDSNASAFAFTGNIANPDMRWYEPSAPEITRIDDLYAIVLTVDEYREGTGNPEKEVGLALPFRVGDARSQAEPSAPPYRWRLANEILPLTNVIDVVSMPDCPDPITGGEAGYVAVSYKVDSSNVSYVGWWRLVAQANGSLIHNNNTVSPSLYDAVPLDLSITLDGACDPYVIGCARPPTPSLHITHGQEGLPNLANAQDDTLPGDVCYPMRSPLSTELAVNVCDGANGCTEVEFDINQSSGDPFQVNRTPNPAEMWRAASLHTSRLGEDLRTLLPLAGPGVFLEGDIPLAIQLLDTELVLAADAQLWNGELYMAVVVDDPKSPIRLIHGDPDKPQETNLTFVPPEGFEGVTPADIAIHVDDDRIAVAVTALDPSSAPGAQNDVLGWLFLGLPL